MVGTIVYEVKPFGLGALGLWAISLGIIGTISGALLVAVSLMIINARADYRRWWPYN